MHTLKNWAVKRSGARMTVVGFNDLGVFVKVAAVSVQGPGSRVCAPESTIAVQPNGDIVRLI